MVFFIHTDISVFSTLKFIISHYEAVENMLHHLKVVYHLQACLIMKFCAMFDSTLKK